jgi:LuxR family transcriptional regulator, maltose regulon positive regulatory protein
MVMQFVGTKLLPLIDLRCLVERPRLLQPLELVTQHRLTVLRAPAGYGKSSLLTQWHQALQSSGYATAWLSLDESDCDPVTTLSYLAAALPMTASQPHGRKRSTMRGTHAHSTLDSIIACIVNALGTSGLPTVLFLDDVHLLRPDVAAGLSRLIELVPSTTHFAVATRTTPRFNHARIRAQGQLLELSESDLRFTGEEVRAFLAAQGLAEDSAVMIDLAERTEGWIAGLKLACLAIHKGSSKHALANGSSENYDWGWHYISDFFSQEVFTKHPKDVQDFLLKTSVLATLNPALCEAVTERDDARRMLAYLGEAGVFLHVVDAQRHGYRYHHLFAEFLQRRLLDEFRKSEIENLHRRASDWFWQESQPVQAIEHALKCRHPEHAADLLEKACTDMTYAGKFRLILQLAGQIPDDILHRHVHVMLTLAWLLTRNLRFKEVQELLIIVGKRLDEMEATREVTAAELRRLRFLLLHREMVLAAGQDDVLRVEKLCQRLLQEFPEEYHPYLSGTIYGMLLYARREQYKLSDAEQLRATVCGILSRSPYSFSSIGLQASIGRSLFFIGRTDSAKDALEQGLAASRDLAMSALPALPLAEIAYECNDLDRAEKLVNDSLPFATELSFVDQLMPGFLTQARVKYAHGDHPGAYRVLDEAMALAVERCLERLRLAVVAEYVRLQIQDGLLPEAVHYARNAGIPSSKQKLTLKGTITTCDEFTARAWVRIAHAEGRSVDALNVARHWRSYCAASGAIRSLVYWDILLAQLLFTSGDLRAAQRVLREAIARAASCRLIRPFIDEGSIIFTLLSGTYQKETMEASHPTDAFALELLEAFGKRGMANHAAPGAAKPAMNGLYGKLSMREREVLSLVAAGMRNREVAQKLGTTEGSVKWYLQQVYDKVGTHRRLQAVERARQFGLIA